MLSGWPAWPVGLALAVEPSGYHEPSGPIPVLAPGFVRIDFRCIPPELRSSALFAPYQWRELLPPPDLRGVTPEDFRK